MRMLFLAEDYPITPDGQGGASAVIYSHLRLALFSKHNLTIGVLEDSGSPRGFRQHVSENGCDWQSSAFDYRVVPLIRSSRQHAPLRHALLAYRDPDSFVEEYLNDTNIEQLRALISSAQPELIWAEHRIPALLALSAARGVPVIYSHHDWEWRLRTLREPFPVSLKRRMSIALQRRSEERLARRAAGCAAVSSSEASAIERLTPRPVAYLPGSYSPIPSLSDPELWPAVPRVVHLGGMRTTASRIGLQEFLDVCWPAVCRLSSPVPELWVIGTLDGASPRLLRSLKESRAVAPGFLPDLKLALRPGDIHVVPWAHDTGLRTRIPLALNHGQVVVSSAKAAACLSELVHGENCILTSGLHEMAQQISRLLADRPERTTLALRGRATFLNSFTEQALQPRFDSLLDLVLTSWTGEREALSQTSA